MSVLFNFLRGSARIEIYGQYPEQFINAMARRSVPFWKFRKAEKGRASVFVPLSSVGDAQRAGEGTGCEIKVVRKSGFAHFIYGLRHRWVLLAGLFLCFALVSLLSLFVWEIEVTGNERVPTSEILTALGNHGVRIGMFSLAIDQQDLRSRVLYELKDLSWITVNIVGAKAEVIVRERVKKPEMIDVSKPSNVVASKSGVIVKMNVFQGQPLAAVGQTVSKGDVLVGSEMQSLNSGLRRVHAMGEVFARTWYEFSCEMPLEYTSKSYTGKKTKNTTVFFLGRFVNLYFNTGFSDTFCDKIIKTSKVELPGGLLLPVTLSSSEYRWYEPVQARMEKGEAESILKRRLEERLDEMIGDGKKVSVLFESREDNGIVQVTIRAECLEQIGQIQELK